MPRSNTPSGGCRTARGAEFRLRNDGTQVARPWSGQVQLNQEIPMSILATILIGLVVGIVAKFLMPGDDPGGIIMTILLGIAGAFIAGWIGRAAGWYAEGEPVGFIASVLGSILLLVLYRAAFGRRRRLH
ncbi:MAG TPA: GlsB/YeaQ/YmgE family stress response membrane protein [Acidobacteriota bacterium]|nr:GlsB/YeaQ/YmgE family stress response membrane protein [Acidobacteriota bacterium]